MDGQKQILPVRVVAAHFISADVQSGLNLLDEIIEDWYRPVRNEYRIWSNTLTVVSTTLVFCLLVAVIGAIKNTQNQYISIVTVATLSAWFGTALYWRFRQYSGFKPSAVRQVQYSAPNRPAVHNLERFFQIAQLETTPRAFYETRSGVRRYVRRQYFFGSLRVALVAEDRSVREVMFSPWGLWFDRELYMEVDVGALIEQAQVKPEPKKRGPKPYNFTDAVMSLIEHPEIRNLDPKGWGGQTRIIELLENWFRTNRQKVPSEDTIRGVARSIQDVVEKNRSGKS